MARSHKWGRPSPRAERGYGTLHDRIRRRLLKEEPHCRLCLEAGRGEVKATHADHIIPLCKNGPTERSNYQALCRDCSVSKTGREGAEMLAAKRRARKRRADRHGHD